MSEASRSAGAGAAASAAVAPKKKRAVVLIHGIGSQTPMATLRPFVEAVWTSVPALGGSGKALTWSQRDLMSENLELWRITTNADTSGVRTDFFEFYWADMMEDTRLRSVTSWLRRLFVRGWGRVPPAVVEPWIAGWIGAVVFAIVAVGVFLLAHTKLTGFWAIVAGVAVAIAPVVLSYINSDILVAIVGDAARYLTAAPANVAARTRIRLAGLKLLKALHEDESYDRIILVGHSLGTVVGYDLLDFYWSDINDKIRHDPASPALLAVASAGRAVRDDPGKVTEFRNAQRDYCREVGRVAPGAWKITDFVTMGSPLTYAHLLMVDDRQKLLASEEKAIAATWLAPWWARLDAKTKRVAALFRAHTTQRELALIPPLTEKGDEFVYRPGNEDVVVPHHAAVFAAVRWTNIFAPCRLVLKGDVVGGPVAPLFGPGVKDVALTGDVGDMMLAHTHYWDEGRRDSQHLFVLRSALNFLDEAEAPPAAPAPNRA